MSRMVRVLLMVAVFSLAVGLAALVASPSVAFGIGWAGGWLARSIWPAAEGTAE